ncbi:MAG: 50S ribosomal protein L29 [Parcubacteria group bacterium Athens0714_26]|nr:MAG: 50S ribosomal protein L29 [Parcubacteria group bacterium Athens1014_26]TSD03273.1 MAG: 50S ribosomal protein L29 [Parcubacteria group bacterium Athens0714_26]
MKRKDLEQLKNKPKQELQHDLSKNHEKLWNLKIDLAAGKVKNVREIRQLKRTIAKINTFLNAK